MQQNEWFLYIDVFFQNVSPAYCFTKSYDSFLSSWKDPRVFVSLKQRLCY